MKMKKLIFLLLLTFGVASGQHILSPSGNTNVNGFLSRLNGGPDTSYTIIKGRTFTGGVTDTTIILSTVQHKTLYVSVTAKDSGTFLISYSVSNDGSNFTAFVTKDSLSHNADGVGAKSVDFTSTILGYPYVRFRIVSSVLAFAYGTTSPTYSASYLWKKE